MRAIRLLLATALLIGIWGGGSAAAELKVLCAIALRPPLQELAPAFEASSGHKLKIEYATAGAIEQKVNNEDEADVVILTKPLVDKLVRSAKIVGGTATPLARAEIGVAVRKGAAKPDIGSVEALKQSLLKAKAIAYADPAGGAAIGAQVAKALEKLGIADAVKPKTRLYQPPPARAAKADDVLPGDAEIALSSIGFMKSIDGLDVVGPLPAELQSPDLTFVAGSPMVSENPVAAKQLIDFLAGQKAKEVYKAKDLQPG
jgi:molybdate transport system substrate-binding protein